MLSAAASHAYAVEYRCGQPQVIKFSGSPLEVKISLDLAAALSRAAERLLRHGGARLVSINFHSMADSRSESVVHGPCRPQMTGLVFRLQFHPQTDVVLARPLRASATHLSADVRASVEHCGSTYRCCSV